MFRNKYIFTCRLSITFVCVCMCVSVGVCLNMCVCVCSSRLTSIPFNSFILLALYSFFLLILFILATSYVLVDSVGVQMLCHCMFIIIPSRQLLLNQYFVSAETQS